MCIIYIGVIWLICTGVIWLVSPAAIALRMLCDTEVFCKLRIFVTEPAERDQVGTKYTISQNSTYLEFCVQYLLSVSYKMLPMKLLINGNFIYITFADH